MTIFFLGRRQTCPRNADVDQEDKMDRRFALIVLVAVMVGGFAATIEWGSAVIYILLLCGVVILALVAIYILISGFLDLINK